MPNGIGVETTESGVYTKVVEIHHSAGMCWSETTTGKRRVTERMVPDISGDEMFDNAMSDGEGRME